MMRCVDKPGSVICLAPLLILFGALSAGAWLAWPVYDDTALVLLRNGTAGGQTLNAGTRPLYAALIDAVGKATHLQLLCITANSILWLLLALEVRALWRLLVPGSADGVVPALLVLAPLLVQTQLTTVTTSFTATLPVIIAVAGLLSCLSFRENLIAAIPLAFSASLASEYGTIAALAGASMCVGLKKWRAAFVVSSAAAVGHLIFRLVAVHRTSTDLIGAIAKLKLFDLVIKLIGGIWHASMGAWLRAVGSIWLDSDSLSTAFATLIGLVLAGTVYRILRLQTVRQEIARPMVVAPFLSVCIAVFPIAFASAPTNYSGFDSRYLLPALPFAACVITSIVLSLTSGRRFQIAALLLLTAGAGYSTAVFCWREFKVRREMAQLGRMLLPVVQAAPGITVLVLDTPERLDYQQSCRLFMDWTIGDSLKAWSLTPDSAAVIFGPRTHCKDIKQIAFLQRSGPLSALVWAQADVLEPYCIAPVAGLK